MHAVVTARKEKPFASYIKSVSGLTHRRAYRFFFSFPPFAGDCLLFPARSVFREALDREGRFHAYLVSGRRTVHAPVYV